ncbi:hypothetical protein SGUI_0601 [Serinicoccus hydrothermalis]|uniref:Uncharacterized protein n=1 Tax=Serinicoccus hydrothermalis TaxID=1758689 RepID=A0A1B1N987_9MICO|nr:hypothetical protein [Serinicoccus hydrothermalis]ANS77997.1 hypothetical protein SGUI_0601 [Serinicoccus hydrothermalis]
MERSQHRPTITPRARRARTARGAVAALDPTRYAPEVQLALAALLVVVAGPVAGALAPTSAVVAGASVVLLLVGVTLAVLATVSLLRHS